MSISIVIPTLGDVDKLGRCLVALRRQSKPPTCIYLVSPEGLSLSALHESAGDLELLCLVGGRPNQVEQRRVGIEHFLSRSDSEWLLFLDDDLELRPDALERLMELSKICDTNTLGIALRIEPSTSKRRQRNRIAIRLGIVGSRPGSVALSGENVTYDEADHNAQLEWAAGGASMWRRAVLETHSHPRLPDRYAFLEDVIFSYRISTVGKIVLCRSAVAEHVSVPPRIDDYWTARDKGFIAGLHGAYFVWANPGSLSRWRYLALISGRSLTGISRLILSPSRAALGDTWGTTLSLGTVLRALITFVSDPTWFFHRGPRALQEDVASSSRRD